MSKPGRQSRKNEIPPTPLAYRIPRAAAMIGISPSTMWGKIARGEIEACKIGSATVIRHSDLDTYVKSLPVVTPARRDLRPVRA